MKLLIAPIHYLMDETIGSEPTRNYEYIKALSLQNDVSGDAIVGYSEIKNVGKIKIHNIFKHKLDYISSIQRLMFPFQVYLLSKKLQNKNEYDCMWHLGPFAINKTFSLVGMLNRGKTKFVIGPIYTPFGHSNNKIDISNIKHDHGGEFSAFMKLDMFLYNYFSKFFKYFSQKTLESADQIITIDHTGEKMIRELGIKDVQTITLGVIQDKFNKKPRLKTHNIIRLLSVGYLLERKRIQDLISALHILITKYKITKIKLTIVGDGPMRDHLEKLSLKLGVSRYISFEGFVPRTKVHNFYRESDIFLSGSILDSMPGMYFEAMSASLPMVIIENISSIELRKNKFGGFVVSGKNPDQIAKSIYTLIKNISVYKNFSNRNFELMGNDYNFNKNILKLMHLLK